MNLKLLILSLISRSAADSWTNICEDHPLAAERNTGKTEPYDPKDPTSTASTVKCTIEYDFDYPDQYIEKFCTARFYASLHSHVINRDKKRLKCIYETDSYCDDDDININGMCYRLHKDAETLAEAKNICGREGSEILSLSDKDAAEWILKIHDPNSDHIIPKIWFDTHISNIESADVYEHADFGISKTASVFLLRYHWPIPLSLFIPADPKEKHPFYCRKPNKFFPAAFRRYCDIVNTEFKIPAAYSHSTCFMMSMSVHRPKFINGEIDNSHYNEDCNYVQNMKTYAVAPTSRVKFDGMVNAVTSVYPIDGNKTPRIVTPGHSTDKAIALQTTCSTRTRSLINKFKYIASDGISYNVDTSGWDGTALSRECADLHRDVVVLAPDSGRHIHREPVPTGAEALFSAYDYPRFFRGHKICAAGFEKKDIFMTKCEAGWTGVPRDDGTMACHKVLLSEDHIKKKSDMIQMCKEASGDHLAPIESAKELNLIYDLFYKELERVGRHKEEQSIMVGLSSDGEMKFYADSVAGDKKPIYYSNWLPYEPNNYGGREMCVQMMFYRSGKWNDIACNENKLNPILKYRVRGVVCSKPATRL